MAVAAAAHQRDAKAANLRAQARSQKLELEALIKRSLSVAVTGRSGTAAGRGAGRGRRGNGPQHARPLKLLDSDVEFTRKNLRNTYLTLLFSFTFNRLAHGVDNLLWTDTSYCLISAFRTLISNQQNALSTAAGANNGGAAASGNSNGRGKAANDVARTQNELRKLLQDEETFWRELAASIVRIFSVDEARSNLEALGIACDSDGDTTVSSVSQNSDSLVSSLGRHQTQPSETLSQAALLPANRSHLLEIIQKALIFCGDLARYRELHCPPSDAAAATTTEADDRGSTAQRAGGRGGGSRRGGAANAAAASSSLKTAAASAAYKQDFGRALAFYEQARLLLPDNGNPSNQLAVIATYNVDPLLSIYHCYRALCVRLPFEKAKVNLDKTLAKPIETWLDAGMDQTRTWDDEQERQARSPEAVELLSIDLGESEQRTDRWIGDVVVLHGLFFQRVHLDCIMPLSHSVLASFASLVRARALPADLIVRVVVTGLCASWTTRLWHNTPSSTTASRQRASRDAARSRSDTIRSSARSSVVCGLDPASRLCIEHQILAHVLGIFRELADIVLDETQQAIQAVRANPLSELAGAAASSAAVRHLTAVVRRTLPALRVATKWMKTHLEYIQRSGERATASSQNSDGSSLLQPSLNQTLEAIPNEEELREVKVRAQADGDAVKAIDGFWRRYVAMINVLRYAFPFETLPNIGKAGPVGAPTLCLEEDSDMRGLTPTKKAMQLTAPGPGGGTVVSVGIGEACANANAVRPSQVHPNEEQLMRVADLLIDAKVVAESDASPIRYDDGQNLFVYDGEAVFGAASQTQPRAPLQFEASGSPATVTPPSLKPAPSALPKTTATEGGGAGVGIGAGVGMGIGGALKGKSDKQDEASSEGFSEMTDDPVELAMRAVDGRRTGDGIVMDGLEESVRNVRVDDRDRDDQDDDDSGEQILVPSQIRRFGDRAHNAEAARLFAQATTTANAGMSAYPSQTIRPTSMLTPGCDVPRGPATAQDLLLQMLQGRSSGPAQTTPPGYTVPGKAPTSANAQPHLLFGGVIGANGSPDGHGNSGRSIWSPGPADAQLPVGSPPQAGPSFGSALPPAASYGWGRMPSDPALQQLGSHDPSSTAQEGFGGHSMTPSGSYGFGAGVGLPQGQAQLSSSYGMHGDVGGGLFGNGGEAHFGDSPFGQQLASHGHGHSYESPFGSGVSGGMTGGRDAQARFPSADGVHGYHQQQGYSSGGGYGGAAQDFYDPHPR